MIVSLHFPFGCKNNLSVSLHSSYLMKKFTHPQDGASKGAALIIVLAFVVLLTAFGLTYFSRTTADRQLAHSSSNDTTADLLARSALDITVSDLKQEIANNQPVTAAQYSAITLRCPTDHGSVACSEFDSAQFSRGPHRPHFRYKFRPQRRQTGASISRARWNSHYLIPRASTTTDIDSTPLSSFTAPDWVLVTAQGPKPTPRAK